jgi:hypothetical protein
MKGKAETRISLYECGNKKLVNGGIVIVMERNLWS